MPLKYPMIHYIPSYVKCGIEFLPSCQVCRKVLHSCLYHCSTYHCRLYCTVMELWDLVGCQLHNVVVCRTCYSCVRYFSLLHRANTRFESIMRCRILIIISWSWFIFIYFTGPISLLNTLQPHCWAGCNRFGWVFGGRFFERYEGKNRASWKTCWCVKLHCTICLHMHDRLIDVSPLFVCSNWQLYWYLHYYTPLPTY